MSSLDILYVCFTGRLLEKAVSYIQILVEKLFFILIPWKPFFFCHIFFSNVFLCCHSRGIICQNMKWSLFLVACFYQGILILALLVSSFIRLPRGFETLEAGGCFIKLASKLHLLAGAYGDGKKCRERI